VEKLRHQLKDVTNQLQVTKVSKMYYLNFPLLMNYLRILQVANASLTRIIEKKKLDATATGAVRRA
jgi:hypothetical protein